MDWYGPDKHSPETDVDLARSRPYPLDSALTDHTPQALRPGLPTILTLWRENETVREGELEICVPYELGLYRDLDHHRMAVYDGCTKVQERAKCYEKFNLLKKNSQKVSPAPKSRREFGLSPLPLPPNALNSPRDRETMGNYDPFSDF
ncbi:hypothetical protein RRG08_038850 [Elysia crispata]|uniref:Uncharacterized protein n=1 Tax=Elysia crispata TaxID=231223 RepID=A0AAE1D3T5_9GAST|nr:hypothetical protein RRG08_038850 [Elysia crispata]